MLLDALRLLLAVGILVVLPGWLLASALFPRKEQLGGAARLFVVLSGGILVTMSVGILLGFLPHGERGALQSLATEGMPNVELAVLVACLGLFWLGVQRGAHEDVARRYPRLAAPWRSPLKAGQQQP